MSSSEGEKHYMSLHDGTLQNHWWEGYDVLISITKWDETLLRFRCKDVVLLKELIADGLDKLIECDESDLLQEAKLRVATLHYPEGYSEKLRHFRVLDDTNCPVLDVICTEIIEEEPDEDKRQRRTINGR